MPCTMQEVIWADNVFARQRLALKVPPLDARRLNEYSEAAYLQCISLKARPHVVFTDTVKKEVEDRFRRQVHQVQTEQSDISDENQDDDGLFPDDLDDELLDGLAMDTSSPSSQENVNEPRVSRRDVDPSQNFQFEATNPGLIEFDPIEREKQGTSVIDFVNWFNEAMGSNPRLNQTFYKPPLWIDWRPVLLRKDSKGESIDKYFDLFPDEVKKFNLINRYPSKDQPPKCNPFKLPPDVALSDIKFRLLVAPNVQFKWTTLKVLQVLGFNTVAVPETALGGNAFIYKNKLDKPVSINAITPPTADRVGQNTKMDVTVSLMPFEFKRVFQAPEFETSVVSKDYALARDYVINLFEMVEEATNLVISVQMIDDEDKLTLVVGVESKTILFHFLMSHYLSDQLAYYPNTKVNNANPFMFFEITKLPAAPAPDGTYNIATNEANVPVTSTETGTYNIDTNDANVPIQAGGENTNEKEGAKEAEDTTSSPKDNQSVVDQTIASADNEQTNQVIDIDDPVSPSPSPPAPPPSPLVVVPERKATPPSPIPLPVDTPSPNPDLSESPDPLPVPLPLTVLGHAQSYVDYVGCIYGTLNGVSDPYFPGKLFFVLQPTSQGTWALFDSAYLDVPFLLRKRDLDKVDVDPLVISLNHYREGRLVPLNGHTLVVEGLFLFRG